jgi:hypothetical protein
MTLICAPLRLGGIFVTQTDYKHCCCSYHLTNELASAGFEHLPTMGVSVTYAMADVESKRQRSRGGEG